MRIMTVIIVALHTTEVETVNNTPLYLLSHTHTHTNTRAVGTVLEHGALSLWSANCIVVVVHNLCQVEV